MHSFASIVAVVAISLHSVHGCCWHRAPMERAAVVFADATSLTLAKHGGCGCRPINYSPSLKQHPTAPSDKSPAPEPCREQCDFSVVSRVDHDESDQRADFGSLAVAVSVQVELTDISPIFFEDASIVDPSSLRLHLRYCRLVI